MSEQPQHSRVDLADIAPDKRIAFARPLLPDGWEVEPAEGHGTITGCADFWLVNRMIAVRIGGVSCRVAGGSSKTDAHKVRLRLVTGGSATGIVDGEPMELAPGDITFEADTGEMAVTLDGLDCLVISVPALEAKFDPDVHPRFAIVPNQSVAARMLAAVIREVFDLLPEASVREAEMAAEILPRLIGESLSRVAEFGQPRRASRAQQLQAMKAFIEERLPDPALDVATLVDTFPVSRAVAYRLFQRDGGLANYIRERRMVRAARMLAFSDSRMTMDAVAKAVGMPNSSQFSRAFRKQFGLSPSEVRSRYRLDGPDRESPLAHKLQRALDDRFGDSS